MRDSVETGFPELPEGYNWSVGPKEGYEMGWGDGWKCYGISIRAGRKRLYRSGEIKFPTEWILYDEACKLWDQMDENRRAAAAREKFAGDYPPKRLGN